MRAGAKGRQGDVSRAAELRARLKERCVKRRDGRDVRLEMEAGCGGGVDMGGLDPYAGNLQVFTQVAQDARQRDGSCGFKKRETRTGLGHKYRFLGSFGCVGRMTARDPGIGRIDPTMRGVANSEIVSGARLGKNGGGAA